MPDPAEVAELDSPPSDFEHWFVSLQLRAAEAENAKLRRALQEMADAYRRTGLDMSPEGRAYLAKIDTLIGGDDA